MGAGGSTGGRPPWMESLMLALNRCRYRRGPRQGENSLGAYCEKDVSIRALVGGPDYGWACRTPCSPFLWKADMPAVPFCVYYDAPTPEEVAAEEAEIKAWVSKVMPWADSVKRRHSRGSHATESCPLCGGEVHITIAQSNGHLHAKCGTPNCLAVME